MWFLICNAVMPRINNLVPGNTCDSSRSSGHIFPSQAPSIPSIFFHFSEDVVSYYIVFKRAWKVNLYGPSGTR